MNKLAELLEEARAYVESVVGDVDMWGEPCEPFAEGLIKRIDAALDEYKKVESEDIFWNKVSDKSGWQCADFGDHHFLEVLDTDDGRKWHWAIRTDIKGTALTEAEAKEAAIKAAKGL